MKLHVEAVGDRLSTLLDPASGLVVVGRYAARQKKTHAPMLEGELVADHPHYRRAIARGDLALVEEVTS